MSLLTRACAALSAGLLGCAGERAPASATPAPARNLVLFVVDTLRADHLGAYGYELDTSPFLERFARERGVLFEAARATAPWTKPSVASLLTGLDPRHHHVTLHPHRLHSELETLAEVLTRAGFDTAAIQSNILLASPFGYGQGFARYDEDALAEYDRSTGAEVHAAAVRFLREQRDPERPFFLWIHHYEPHFNYLKPGDAFARAPYAGPLQGTETMEALVAATASLTPADVDFLRARYDAEVRWQDELFERFVSELDALGLSDETLVVFTADHGEEFGEHGELSHQHKLFDELLHVPLVVARPGEPAPGRRIAAPVSLSAVGRTVLDLLGLAEQRFPGTSLAPLLDGGPAPTGLVLAQTETIPNLPGGKGAEVWSLDMALSGPWKLVRDHESGARALYRLDLDPGERRDVAAEEPERAAELEARLEEWLLRHRRLEQQLAPEALELSEELLQRMRDLGYVGGG